MNYTFRILMYMPFLLFLEETGVGSPHGFENHSATSKAQSFDAIFFRHLQDVSIVAIIMVSKTEDGVSITSHPAI